MTATEKEGCSDMKPHEAEVSQAKPEPKDDKGDAGLGPDPKPVKSGGFIPKFSGL